MNKQQKIFDSHSHYNDDAFITDEKEILQHIKSNDIGYVVNCGYNLVSSQKALKQASENDFIFCSVGYHPQDADKMTQQDFDEIEKLLSCPKVVALGEIGLDYYYPDSPDKEVQKQVFLKQLELAVKFNKPIIVHTRDAMQDTIEILKPFASRLKGVIHCYSGSAESCAELCKMGFYIGFTGVVTFKNAKKALQSLKVVPLDKLLVETDCPYMAPEPYRGKRCDSSLLHFTIQKIAEELSLSKQEVIELTTNNAKKLFNIQ